MAEGYVLDLQEILQDTQAFVYEALAENLLDDAEIEARLAKIELEIADEFIDWVERQSELVADRMGDEAPSRSGNLASSIYTKKTGNTFTQNTDVGYADIVISGRKGFGPKSGQYLIFPESRGNWRPGNLAYVSGPGSGNYPNFNITRSKYRLLKVGPAPAINFPAAGFDKWAAGDLGPEADLLKLLISNIILENGGTVTSVS